jgi:hypothetical protein
MKIKVVQFIWEPYRQPTADSGDTLVLHVIELTGQHLCGYGARHRAGKK